MSEGIAIQLIITVGTVIGAYFLARQQWRKDRIENESSREERLDKREAEFWARAEARDAEREAEIKQVKDELTAVRAQLASVKVELSTERELRRKLEARILTLENENGHLKAENDRLKSGKGKMGL